MIRATAITLRRLEATPRTDIVVKIQGSPEFGYVWRRADIELYHWSQNVPKDVGYYKVEFTVRFEDGGSFTGRYDLRPYPKGKLPDLGAHVREFLEVHSGRRRPKGMRRKRYEKMLAELGKEVRDYRLFLDTHQIGVPSHEETTPTRRFLVWQRALDLYHQKFGHRQTDENWEEWMDLLRRAEKEIDKKIVPFQPARRLRLRPAVNLGQRKELP